MSKDSQLAKVDFVLIENILRTYLPQLKSKISKIKIELQK